MKKIIPVFLLAIILIAGCILNPEKTEPTGQTIASKTINYPEEMEKSILSGTSFPYLKQISYSDFTVKENLTVGNMNKVNGISYQVNFTPGISFGETAKIIWLQEEAELNALNKDIIAVTQNKKTIMLKNFNKYKSKLNTEFIFSPDGKLTGIKIYNTQPITAKELTEMLYFK